MSSIEENGSTDRSRGLVVVVVVVVLAGLLLSVYYLSNSLLRSSCSWEGERAGPSALFSRRVGVL